MTKRLHVTILRPCPAIDSSGLRLDSLVFGQLNEVTFRSLEGQV
jgi:hypothetical protein